MEKKNVWLCNECDIEYINRNSKCPKCGTQPNVHRTPKSKEKNLKENTILKYHRFLELD